MVRLTTRVETMREVLEKFLDDDSDMHDMNLTARQQDMLERQTSLIRNSLARSSFTGEAPHRQVVFPFGFWGAWLVMLQVACIHA